MLLSKSSVAYTVIKKKEKIYIYIYIYMLQDFGKRYVDLSVPVGG